MSLEIQWTDSDPETGERRFVSVERFAREWHFKVRHRRRENWNRKVVVTKAMWVDLLESLERRVQRSEAVSDADVAAVRKIVESFPRE